MMASIKIMPICKLLANHDEDYELLFTMDDKVPLTPFVAYNLSCHGNNTAIIPVE
jgi:hypothetical protein